MKPLDRDSLLVEFAGRVSTLVAGSSLAIGVVLLAHLTTFPPQAYRLVPETYWGVAFAALGIVHLALLQRWWSGHGSDALANVHLWTYCLALLFAVASFWSAFNNGVGFLVTTFVVGGAALAALTSRLAVWRSSGSARGR